MTDQVFRKASSAIIAAGLYPIPVNDTLIELLKVVMTEEQAEFITLFDRSLNRGEIIEKSGLDDASLDKMLNSLMDSGVLTGIPGKGSGAVIYRVQPPIPGLFEFTLMRGETGEKQKKLAQLFEKLFEELAVMVQANYDVLTPAFKAIPAMTRVVPIETEIDRKFDTIMPCEDVKKIVERFDTIAMVHCYCRHQKDLLGKHCTVTDERKNCLMFGRTAQFVIDHKFGEKITKEQANAILEDAKKSGLVHKAFHEKSDTGKEEVAICNCCKCCCETFQIFYRGGAPSVTNSSYIAEIDSEQCSGCEVCTEMCPMEAFTMDNGVAVLDSSRCIGCGVCSYNCGTGAISLKRTGERTVFVPPPRRKVAGR
jgi:NAD-dependent dihydropyrimidine dehydrogenase PreA subunit